MLSSLPDESAPIHRPLTKWQWGLPWEGGSPPDPAVLRRHVRTPILTNARPAGLDLLKGRQNP